MGVYIWNKLPSEYQEVEYIQSSGTQYIDTGYGNSYGVYVDMELEYTSTPSTQVIFGTEVGSGASQRLYIGATTKHSIWSSTAEANGGSVQTNTRYVYNASFVAGTGASLYVNNTLTASTSTTGYPSANLFVFAGNLRGSVAALGYMKLYYLKIYTPDKSTLVRDFVPCYRKSDNVIGMYDLVNDTFYTNQGSGTFTKGSEVNNYYEKELKNAYIGEYPPIPTTYTPNENTLLYIPMKKDLLDYSGKDVVVDNNNLATVDTSILSSGMGVGNFSSGPLTISIGGIEIKSPFTISMWVYIPNFVYRGSYSIFNLGGIGMSYGPSGKYSSYIYIGGKTFSASVLEGGGWINFIIRYNGSVCNLLSNLTSSGNQTITVSGGPTSTISNICSYVGYMSDLIYENSYWSDAQCAEYHNNSSQYYS